MKKVIMLMIMVLLVVFTQNVNAANKVVKPEDPDYATFQREYEKGIQTITVNSGGLVTLYGYSDCQTGSCTYKYANATYDFKEVLKKAVRCSGGENHIIYQTTGGADGFKTNNSENYIGKVYWTEDFNITCTNTASSNTVQLENTITQNPTNSGTGNYGSSTTTNNESQGVGTYYMILAIVGVIAYMLTIVIKKQNLFKSI